MASLFNQAHAEWSASAERHLVDIAERLRDLLERSPRTETPTLLPSHLRTIVATVEAALQHTRRKPENRQRR